MNATVRLYSSVVGGNSFALLMRLLAISIVAHLLLENEFAQFIYLYNSALFVALLSDVGMRNSLFVEIGKSGKLDNDQFSGVFTVRLLFGALAFSVMLIWALVYFANLQTIDLEDLLVGILFAVLAANTPAADLSLHVLRGLGYAKQEAWIKGAEVALICVFSAVMLSFWPAAMLAILLWVAIGASRSLFSFKLALSRSQIFPKFDLSRSIGITKSQMKYLFLVISNSLGMRYAILVSPALLPAKGVVFISLSLMLSQIVQVLSSSLAHQFYSFSTKAEQLQLRNIISVCAGLFVVGAVIGAGFYLLIDIAGLILNFDFKPYKAATLWIAVSIPFLLCNDFLRFAQVYFNTTWAYGGIAMAVACAALLVLLILFLSGFSVSAENLALLHLTTQILIGCGALLLLLVKTTRLR